ncbi:hypothetical protein T06_2066 [Trichinella sp. T6]|nr:hypothetical protein T06_2066 [Trichinella sp. T6]
MQCHWHTICSRFSFQPGQKFGLEKKNSNGANCVVMHKGINSSTCEVLVKLAVSKHNMTARYDYPLGRCSMA